MNIDDQLHGISTIIYTVWSTKETSSASGFFYHKYETPVNKPSPSPRWVRVEEQWLVTNRHVLINDRNELANSITFHHRKITTGGVQWFPIKISRTELHSRCKFHKSDEVDIAIINVLDLLNNNIPKSRQEGEGIMSWGAVSAEVFPGADKISVGVGDEALVIGYPKGYYDEFSKFPIVKSGIIASKWGVPFNSQPYFLIDAKLFPGSSGSLVISRPTNFIIEKGEMYLRSKGQKVFAFLGILSGGLEEYNISVVWYYYLIPEIISNGKLHDAQKV